MILSALLLLAAQPSPAEGAIPSEIHKFNDWVVTCDNGLRCSAVSLVPEAAEQEEGEAGATAWERFGVIRLERGPEADAPLVITIGDFDGTPARLLQHGAPLDFGITAGSEREWRIAPKDLGELVTRLYSGSWQVQDAGSKLLSELSVDGAYQAMIYMDERQGRRYTTTGLVRRGTLPASAVPPPPPVPVVQLAPRTSERALDIPQSRIDRARREKGCLGSEVGGVDTHEVAPLGNGRTLVLMTCGAGAYNFNSIPLIAWREGGDIRIEEARTDHLTLFIHEYAEGEQQKFLVTLSDYDPDTRLLHGYAKGRGIGDCGVASTYGWDGQRFRLVLQNEMSECRGTQELLTTWRAETR